jgi:hypothetical protein
MEARAAAAHGAEAAARQHGGHRVAAQLEIESKNQAKMKAVYHILLSSA